MKNYGKLISVIAVLIGLFVMSVSVSAADLAIIVVDGKAVVGNGTSLHRMTRTENLQRL